jgi:hypothetical protein
MINWLLLFGPAGHGKNSVDWAREVNDPSGERFNN